MTIGGGNPLENKGFGGADSTKIGHLLIPSCESQGRCIAPNRNAASTFARMSPGSKSATRHPAGSARGTEAIKAFLIASRPDSIAYFTTAENGFLLDLPSTATMPASTTTSTAPLKGFVRLIVTDSALLL